MKNDAAIKEVCDFVEGQEFDTAVVILLDRADGNRMKNWWHFSGHPNTWTSSDMSSIVQRMAAQTAELLKTDVNVGRELYYTGPRITIASPKEREATNKASPAFIYLYGVILSIVRFGGKRLYLAVWLNLRNFGLDVAWGNGLTLYVGPLSFTARYQA